MRRHLIAFTLIILGISFVRCQKNTNLKLKVGDKVPSFSLLDQNANVFMSDMFVGKQTLVIYFYPKDNTSGCTKEACKFRDEFDFFSELNIKIIGISKDDVASHKKFAEEYNLPFVLLADTKNEVRKLFGVPNYAAGLIPGRVTYIIDKEGKINYIFNNMRKAELHVAKAIEIVNKKENAN